jgi:DNA-binding PadR family transcriptional regulator
MRHQGGGGRGGRARGGGRGGRPGGHRGRRGDVRAAILALLAERPMHGYEMLEELSRRTEGLWRPSPGSLYPALQLLEDQGLVRSAVADGRRRFELTPDGRTATPAGPAPWEALVSSAGSAAVALTTALRGVEAAIGQLVAVGTAEQQARAETMLNDLRRQVYLLLAEPPSSGGGQPDQGR